jgi:hypothetical protein
LTIIYLFEGAIEYMQIWQCALSLCKILFPHEFFGLHTVASIARSVISDSAVFIVSIHILPMDNFAADEITFSVKGVVEGGAGRLNRSADGGDWRVGRLF